MIHQVKLLKLLIAFFILLIVFCSSRIPAWFFVFIFLFKDFIYLFLERQEGKEKERERSVDVWEINLLVASCTPPTEDLACNPGMCPDWELNWWPFSLQAGTQSTEPHQPGHPVWFLWFLFVKPFILSMCSFPDFIELIICVFMKLLSFFRTNILNFLSDNF